MDSFDRQILAVLKDGRSGLSPDPAESDVFAQHLEAAPGQLGT